MSEWTEATVAQRLRDAAHDRRGLERHLGLEVQLVDAMARISEAKRWTGWLELHDRELVALRSAGAAWKPVCWRLGMSRATAHRRWRSALRLIAERLNRRVATTNIEASPHRNDETSSMATGQSGSTISHVRRQKI